jgi:hypothetical protein
MSTATETSKKSDSAVLGTLGLAAEFDFMGQRYAVVSHKQVNTSIKRLSDGKMFNLKSRATVQNVEEFFYPLQDKKIAELIPLPTLRMGDAVRVKAGRFAGKVGILAMLNSKSYTIAVLGEPTLRVGFESIEKIDKSEFVGALMFPNGLNVPE